VSQFGIWVGSGRFEPKEHRRRKDRAAFVVAVWGGGIPVPADSEVWRSIVRFLSGVRGEARPKTNLVHSRAARKPLVAVIFSILKCIFYTRLIKI